MLEKNSGKKIKVLECPEMARFSIDAPDTSADILGGVILCYEFAKY
jgi:hypothetical protein